MENSEINKNLTKKNLFKTFLFNVFFYIVFEVAQYSLPASSLIFSTFIGTKFKYFGNSGKITITDECNSHSSTIV